ncbi:hypothetical protein FACS1894180_3100 [Bacteroidia bacterium]|nr:hypothetical protein FACS1894180_3100 [Bacteroidia bacterium]
MERNKINSLAALRARKSQIGEQLAHNEQQIRYGFYLYTHPVEWVANALTEKNLPVTSRNLVKLASYSSRFVRYGRLVYSFIKLFRKG